jgi:hypothetical protein
MIGHRPFLIDSLSIPPAWALPVTSQLNQGETSMSETAANSRIAELNDAFRKSFLGGTVILTPGFLALAEEAQQAALIQVRAFNDFSEDNDPYGEHDFGSFRSDGKKFFWKIDYYDLAMVYRSEDPANPAITKRVLTVMLAEEY